MMLNFPVLPLSSQTFKWEKSSSKTSARYTYFRKKVSLPIPSASSRCFYADSKQCDSPVKQTCFKVSHTIRAETQSIAAILLEKQRKKNGFTYEPLPRNHFCCKAIEKGDNPYDGLNKGSFSSIEWTKNYLPLSRTFHLIIPFLATQWKVIIKAWAFTLISVFSMFTLISESGKFTSIISEGVINCGHGRFIYMALLLVVRAVSKFFQQSFLAEVSSNVTYNIRRYVFDKVLHNDQSYFESRHGPPSGDIAYRITSEAEDTSDTIYALLEMLIPSILQLIVVSIQMIMSSPLLSIVIILVVPMMSFVVAALGERLRLISREGHNSIANLSSYLNEILQSMFIVKAYSAEAFEQSRFEKLALMDATARLKKRRMKAFIPEAITAFYATIALILFSVAAWAMSSGSLGGTNVVSFMTSLVLLIDPIQAVGKSFNELKQGEPAIEHLFELITPQKRTNRFGSLVLQHVCGDVKFSSVTFKYGDALPNTLTSVSFHIQAGETVALVGPSGGGKTTIAKLLLGLYEPTKGSIFIDGYDIRYFNKESLRKHVTIVPQNVDLFSGTVAENIAYGDFACSANMEEIKRSAMLANAHDFIKKLPDGYNTKLTESTSQLSGGQRQRLSIARAIYRRSSILILDEATSNLDNISEDLVKSALDRCMIGQTVFVIAHQLETVRRADTIYFLKNGRILEQGTHSSLIALGGHYASLYGTKETTSN